MMYRGPVLLRTGNDHVATPSNLRVEMPEPASTPIRLTLWTLPNKKMPRYPVILEAAGLMKCQSLPVDNGWAPPVVMGTWQFGGFSATSPTFHLGSYWQLAFALFQKRLSNSMNEFSSVFLKFLLSLGLFRIGKFCFSDDLLEMGEAHLCWRKSGFFLQKVFIALIVSN